MLFSKHQKLLCIGDSVTDCERARSVGEGLFGASGKGWVALVDAHLQVVHPALGVRVVNMGTSGNTVRDLAARWQSDVLDLKPDWVAVMIGINDVWRQFDLPRQPECSVPLEEYRTILDDLVARTRPTVRGMILMTPFFIEDHTGDAMRARMDAYGAVVKVIAHQRNCTFVDTQAAFAPLLEHMHSAAIAWDRVHPNHIGHLALARSFLTATGC